MHKEREKCQKRENNNLAIKVKHLCSSSRAVDNVEPCPVSGLIHAETPSGGEVDRMMLTPDDLTTSQSGEGSWADHPLHKPLLNLVFQLPMKPSGGVSLLSTACPGLLAQHLPHMLHFLHHKVGSVDGLHCAGARISSAVQKLYTRVYQSLSRTRSTAAPRRLTSYECNKRRQRTTVNQAIPSTQMSEISGEQNMLQEKESEGVSRYTGSWLVQRSETPRLCTWGHVWTLSKVTPPPDPVPGVTHPVSRTRLPDTGPGVHNHRYPHKWTLKDHF